MAIVKTKKADLMAKYKRVFEISLITALAVMIVAFKFFPELKSKAAVSEGPQELFQVEQIDQTKQENRPPPPPKPPIPIEAPSSDVLEDIEIGDTEIDIHEQVEAPPPPPKEDKKIVEEEPQYFVAVEEMPEPIGGIAEIQKKIIYPEIAKRAGVEGKVYVLAFVNELGIVTDAKIIKGIGAGCDEAALDAVRKTKFKPGKQRGKPVRVQVSIPIVFKLQ
ncbi:MAG: energy transducer TonB [Ignavibacteriaceae bacterium]|nr:energy transducer TonB [Ignavibacterium sp.]MCC6255992.1 energy transducer TonB [Ignavibacteriaceae bacterium]HMN25289.1 energy transducer TonB [Ignavibacteriaceae bacterium]HRN25735.1 energy transducer TonB [Ignavibacteriaceae bacterium]HRQ53988.1 energy transducer TonB [Ignavibacteriaceae bacterium]